MTEDFFFGLRLVMALAPLRGCFRRAALPHALSITAGLGAAAGLAVFTGPITLGCSETGPASRRVAAGWPAVPAQGMRRPEWPLAALQQTQPRTRSAGLRRGAAKIILWRAQGSYSLPRGQVSEKSYLLFSEAPFYLPLPPVPRLSARHPGPLLHRHQPLANWPPDHRHIGSPFRRL
jgi:hypothetical protein